METGSTAPTKKNNTTLILLIAVIIVLGALAGYMTIQNSQLSSSLLAFQSQYYSLNNSYAILSQNYTALSQNYNSLNNDYNNLQLSKNILQGQYNGLNSLYNSLYSDYSAMSSKYQQLSSDVLELNSDLDSYAFFTSALRRTLNDGEIRKTVSATTSAVIGTQDNWVAAEMIYNYVFSHIEYTLDIEMPYLDSLYWQVINGYNYTTSFTVSTTQNYVQTPELTLSIGSGDCDDQAVLTYAMISYYETYLNPPEHLLYLAVMEFSSGPGHIAVIKPGTGGFANIIDPTAGYLTPNFGTTSARKALPELQAYSNFWYYSDGTYITNIKLYRITDDSGNWILVANGTISQVASIFT
jgi:hypothetical protein